MAEPIKLYSPQGTTATVTTPSAVSELLAAGWSLTPLVIVVADAPVIPVTTKRGRPKKGEK